MIINLAENILFNNNQTGIQFVEEINICLLSLGKLKVFNENTIETTLEFYITGVDQDDVKIYNFLVNESVSLGVDKTDNNFYLSQYFYLDSKNLNLREYIISQITDEISEEDITDLFCELL